jgi:hypothetical protein
MIQITLCQTAADNLIDTQVRRLGRSEEPEHSLLSASRVPAKACPTLHAKYVTHDLQNQDNK